jgi:uncharacterized protein (DUF2147 family)
MGSTLVVCLFVLVLGSPSPPEQGPQIGLQGSSRITPVGRWKTVDDATGKVNSVVVIWEEDGTLYGRIEELVNPDPYDPNPRCAHCEGAMKDKPLIGLRILWNLRKSGDHWSGGEILDPDNGKIYRCFVVVENGGKELKIRGFIGFSLLGRTQHWLRDK